MKESPIHTVLAIVLVPALLCVGCGRDAPGPMRSPSTKAQNGRSARTALPRVSNRPANTRGGVFIVLYHRIEAGKSSMDRSPKQFLADLERLERLGFRPVRLKEYLDGKMTLPPGASPVVFTFDDSYESQIRFKPGGALDPTCGLGIWQGFAKKHPDFPLSATFFVLPDVMFGPRAELLAKLKLLRELGCDLGSHTASHLSLRTMPDERVKRELGEAALRLDKFGEKPPYVLAYPLGITPKNKGLVESFSYKERPIAHRAALLVGSNPAPPPGDPKLNMYRIPRIQAAEGYMGLTYWLDLVKKGAYKPYVQP